MSALSLGQFGMVAYFNNTGVYKVAPSIAADLAYLFTTGEVHKKMGYLRGLTGDVQDRQLKWFCSFVHI